MRILGTVGYVFEHWEYTAGNALGVKCNFQRAFAGYHGRYAFTKLY